MSRLRNLFGPAKMAGMAGLFAVVAAACEEDSQTAPDKCGDPSLPLYNILTGGTHAIDNPCVTPVGHAVDKLTGNSGGGVGTGGGHAAGSAGTSGGGSAGNAGMNAMQPAGAGGS